MRHSKRKTLTVEDMNRAMRWYNVQPIYGYESTEDSHSNFKYVEEADVFIEDDDQVTLDNLTVNHTPLDLNPEPSVRGNNGSWLDYLLLISNCLDPAKTNINNLDACIFMKTT